MPDRHQTLAVGLAQALEGEFPDQVVKNGSVHLVEDAIGHLATGNTIENDPYASPPGIRNRSRIE